MCDETSKNAAADFSLGDEHRMLLQIRNTLYEGSWEDFVTDLQARSEGRPHLFITVPPTPAMKAVIARHLALINDMAEWERRTGQSLKA